MSTVTNASNPNDPTGRFGDLVRGISAVRAAAHCQPGRGDCACPICKKGTIRYTVFGPKLKTHGKCSTENCLAWME